VKLELVVPAHFAGIVAEPLTLAADQTTAKVAVRFADAARGPFNMPLLLRATLMDQGHPVVAEARVTLVSGGR
jgi:hypothetical protein